MPSADLKWADSGRAPMSCNPGDDKHVTSCDKASECLFFFENRGKFDLKLEGANPAPAASAK